MLVLVWTRCVARRAQGSTSRRKFGERTQERRRNRSYSGPLQDSPSVDRGARDYSRQSSIVGFSIRSCFCNEVSASWCLGLNGFTLASLSLMVVSTIILLTPAAYHRIVENGEETERFYRLAHVMVLCSLAPLALGVCGDFFIVVYKLTDRLDFSLSVGVIMLLAFVVMWLGYTWLRRNHPRHLVRRPV
jgi:hypothetical protein